jgi:hypothetical protein
MKTIINIIIILTANIVFSQKTQCFINYSNIDKIYYLNSLEDIDSELKKLNYTFNFKSTYITYWNEKAKSNFNIYRNEFTNKIEFLFLDISEKCYNNLKKEIIAAGFVKENEKIDNYRINFYYKKNDKYIILGKVNGLNLDGEVVKIGYDFSICTEEKYFELINR